jgi:pyruvate formate lyase activating enzyme
MGVEDCPTGAIESTAREISVAEALKLALADECFYNASGGGVTFTGGEPLAQGEFLLEVAKLFKSYGIHVCLDTSGYGPERLVCDLAPYLDLVLYDLKYMDDEVHGKLTGVSNKKILSNARKLVELGVPIQFSVPLIPGKTDDAGNLEAAALFVSGLAKLASLANHGRDRPSVRILPYHGSASPKYERKGLVYPCCDLPAPGRSACERAASFFRNQGLETFIGGL